MQAPRNVGRALTSLCPSNSQVLGNHDVGSSKDLRGNGRRPARAACAEPHPRSPSIQPDETVFRKASIGCPPPKHQPPATSTRPARPVRGAPIQSRTLVSSKFRWSGARRKRCRKARTLPSPESSHTAFNKMGRRRRRPERAVPFPRWMLGGPTNFRFQATSRELNISRFGVLLTGFPRSL